MPSVVEALQVAAKLPYRGRLAPSPTGYLHRGHAATFLTAQARARGRALILRVEDLDPQRCKSEYVRALIADMCWIGLEWQEGPDIGGGFGPYRQSERGRFYLDAWRQLAAIGAVYPCTCTRRDLEQVTQAPHAGEQDDIYPGYCRPDVAKPVHLYDPGGVNWRFRVTPGEIVAFFDGAAGSQVYVAGKDFGDFIVWRRDGVPAYQLAVAVDDAAMAITEVVRGADLLLSTAQQLLIYRALGWTPPAFFHCPLVTDASGKRLAKRAGAHTLRELRAAGIDPASLRGCTPRIGVF